jgi:hypothetical protein
MRVIAQLITGPPGTQVTLDVTRQIVGSRSKRLYKFAFYRQKLHSGSLDIRSPVVTPELSSAISVPDPGTVPSDPDAPLSQTAQPSPIETVPSTVSSDPNRKLSSLRGCASISEIESEIHRVLSKQLDSDKIERFETLLKVNSARAFEFLDSEKRQMLSGRSPSDRQEPEPAFDHAAEPEEEMGPRRYYSTPGVSPLPLHFNHTRMRAILKYFQSSLRLMHFSTILALAHFFSSPSLVEDSTTRRVTAKICGYGCLFSVIQKSNQVVSGLMVPTGILEKN